MRAPYWSDKPAPRRAPLPARGGLSRLRFPVLLASVVLFLQTVPVVFATESPPVDIAAAARERATYGLSSDLAAVQAIVATGRDVGTEKWGIVLTADEESELDLAGRMRFAIDTDEALLPYLESLATFAGAYYVANEDGRLVVLLTQTDQTVEQRIRELAPASSLGVDIRLGTYTRRQLEAAAERAWEEWPKLSSTQLLTVGVDEATNQLSIGVSGLDMSAAQPAADQLRDVLGVALQLVAAEPVLELQTCTARYNCFNPHEAGIRIDANQDNGTYCGAGENCCTMGFHIIVSGDKQFLTAGHCGFAHWYHHGSGLVGSRAATMYNATNARDLQRVYVADSQTSNKVYHDTTQWRVIGYGVADPGAPICASLGVSGQNGLPMDCGSITERWTSWFSGECGCTMWGGRYTGIASQGGDSGSPMFAIRSTQYNEVVAYGSLSTGEHFAWVKHGLEFWGASLVTQ